MRSFKFFKYAIIHFIFTLITYSASTLSAQDNNLIQLTDNLRSERDVKVSDKYAVWAGYDSKDAEIFLYHIESGTVKQITQNDFQDVAPALSDKYVIWSSINNQATQIVLYNITNGTQKVIANVPALDATPQVSDKFAVWVNRKTGKGDIFLYDITKGTTTQITSNGFENQKPQVSEQHVVWCSIENGVPAVYAYDIRVGKRWRLNQNLPGWTPQLHGAIAVWQSDNHRIIAYDLATQKFITEDLRGAAPQIVKNQIVWQGGAQNSQDIFIYSLTDKSVRRLFSTGMSYYDLHFSGKYVVWRFFDGSDYELYLYKVAEPTPEVAQNKFSIYPNPITTTLNIIYGETSNKPTRIAIIDGNNNIIKKYENPKPAEDENVITLDLALLAPGFYSLEISTPTSTEKAKIVKR